MKWFSNLFKSGSQDPDYTKPTIEQFDNGFIAPKDSVIVMDPKKDISEPVLAIVKAMKERPSSFKVKINPKKTREDGLHYIVSDIKTKQTLEIHKPIMVYYSRSHRYQFPAEWSWLTSDEREFLVETLTEIYELKLKRKNSIARARMKAIYA